jgi:peroxiredoxin
MPLTKGSPAPDFTLKGNDDKEHRLSDYRGKKVLLVFYPADFSGPCTKEHACLMSDLSHFNEVGAQVLGISVDSIWSHKAFAEKNGIRYPLLADFHPKGDVGRKYGVFVEEKGVNGRTNVVIGPDGKIADLFEYEILSVPETAPVIDSLKKA